MHGCHGVGTWNQTWSARLASWGYVVLDVDSLVPRGHSSVCGRPTVAAGPTRALDAYGAALFLKTLPFIDAKRIAVMGMSHGGWSTLNAINRDTTGRLRSSPFRAAIAFYPWCEGPLKLDAPLLILAAGRDTWTPAAKCSAFVKRVGTRHEMTLKIYANAHHMFDVPGLNGAQLGHTLRHDPKAASDAIARVKDFLTRQL
jgi:dienelactone hydrolase